MVDGGDDGRAVARCRVRMQSATAARVRANEIAKGDVLGVARFAGAQAARSVDDLVPSVTGSRAGVATVELKVTDETVEVACTVEDAPPRDAPVRAMAGAAAAALTVYDMCKAVDTSMVIEDLGLFGDAL